MDLGPVIAPAAGDSHTCARVEDGAVLCWGSNSFGQSEVPAGLDPAVALTMGANHTCALLLDGVVRGWGSSNSGQTQVPGPR